MPSTEPTSSTRAGAVVLAALSFATATAHAAQWSWNAGSGNWTSAGNWTPVGIPGIDPFTTTNIDIGNVPGVQNDTVLLSLFRYGPLHYSDLDVRSGMTLDMGGGQLVNLWGETTLGDSGTTLIVRPSVGPEYADLLSHQLIVGTDSHLRVDAGARVISSDLRSSGLISGEGVIIVQDGGASPRFINRGTLTDGSAGLEIRVPGGAPIDLDGNESGEQILLASPFSQLLIEADRMTDDYNGALIMGSGSRLTLDIAEGWAIESHGTINVSSSIPGAAVQIAGTHGVLRGDLNIGGSHGHLQVLADVRISNLIDVFLGTDDIFELDGPTEILGGHFTLSKGARIDFDGPTIIRDGNFHMVSDDPADGVVSFNGEVEWYGNVDMVGPTTFNGAVRVNDTARVTALSAIEAQVLDMDGVSEDATWLVGFPLTIETARLDTTPGSPSSMDGTIDIGGTLQAMLDMQLATPGEPWQVGGTLIVRGLGPLTVTRVAGSPLEVTGALLAVEGTSIVTADLTIGDSSQLHIADGSTLRVRGGTRVEAGVETTGGGTLQNGLDGMLLLHTGLELGSLGLRNDGVMEIGEAGPGGARVGRFTTMPTSEWRVEIGGSAPATEFDRLEVDGDVELAGVLAIDVLDGFEPGNGATFEFLRWSGSRSGEFDAVITCDGAQVIYGRNAAWIKLPTGVPIAGDVNRDGSVDGHDLAVLFGQWGACASACCSGDLNGDGTIDGSDLAIVLGAWSH